MIMPLYAQIKTLFYYSEHFGIPQGLNHGVIGDIHVDEQGMIWVYTVGSIQRFDGHRFTEVHHEIDEPAFAGQFNGSHPGGVFFLSQTSLYRLDQTSQGDLHVPKLFLTQKSPPNQSLFILYETDTHLFIASPTDSVYQVRKSDLKLERRFKVPVPFHYVFVLNDFETQFALMDKIEYVGQDLMLYRYDPVSLKLDTIVQLDPIRCAIKVALDTFLVLNENSISLIAPGYLKSIDLPDSTQLYLGQILLRISPKEILVALHSGIFTLDISRMQWKSQFEKMGEGAFFDINVRSLQKDLDHNLYLTTFTSGLVKLYPRNAGFDYIGANNAHKLFVRNITGSDISNVILMGTFEDGLYVYDTSGYMLHHFLEYPDRRVNPYVVAIVKISPTHYIFLTDNYYDLKVAGRDIKITKIDTISTKIVSYYSAVIPEKQGSAKYIPGWSGLMVVDVTQKNILGMIKNHPVQFRYAAAPFRDGYLAAGMDTLVWMNKNMDIIRAKFPLPNLRYHRCMLVENDSTILLGTDSGLYRIAISDTATVQARLYDKMVYAIQAGNHPGEYWFSTDYGLFSLQPDGHLNEYSIETGVQENEFNSNSYYKSENGKLYFGGINGITSFYPDEVTQSPDTIRTYISSFSVNNTILANYMTSVEEGHWQFSHDQDNIGIELLGKGKRSPSSYTYQYKIPELSNEWVNMGHDPRIQFHLKPGVYTFYYLVANRFDPNATSGQSISWMIRPPFYRQFWFVSFALLALFSLMGYFIHLQRKRRELRLRYEYQLTQRLQNERMRISRELHDNIGAQMATVKRNLNFLITNNEWLTADQSLQKMKDIEGISGRINQELRDTIWANQHESISINDFIARIKNYIFQMLGPDSHYRLHYEEHGDTAEVLGPFVALNLYRICQEAINNIVKHAQASEIMLAFDGGADHFNVTITDNGIGFDPDAKYEGYGLRNIRHRADQIGGQIQYAQSPDGGRQMTILINTLVLKEKPID